MALLSYVDAITTALREEMRRDETVYLIRKEHGSAFATLTADDRKEFGTDRLIDSGDAEAIIVSSSLGAAMSGMRPVVEMQSADTIASGMAALTQAAAVRFRSAGAQSCPLTVRVGYGGGIGGGLLHSRTNTSWFAHEPGLVVVAPATPYDAAGMLKAAIRADDPVLYFEHRKLYTSLREEIPEEDYTVDLLKAVVTKTGTDATAISYGYALHLTLQAAERVKQQHGINVEVIDMRVLNPIDKDTILTSVAKTSRAVVVYEDNRALGIGAEVSAIIAEEAFDCLDAPIARVAAPDIPAIPFAGTLERFYMPDVDKIAEVLTKTVRY